MAKFLIASLLLVAAHTTAAEPGLHEVCLDFDAWYETHDSADHPAVEYHAELIARGVAATEAERRLAMLGNSASDCPAVNRS